MSTPTEGRPPLTLLCRRPHEMMADSYAMQPLPARTDLLARGLYIMPYVLVAGATTLVAVSATGDVLEFRHVTTVGEREQAIEDLNETLRTCDPESGVVPIGLAQ